MLQLCYVCNVLSVAAGDIVAECILTYWNINQWPASACRCPVCRQNVRICYNMYYISLLILYSIMDDITVGYIILRRIVTLH